jgi:hypothetical protein
MLSLKFNIQICLIILVILLSFINFKTTENFDNRFKKYKDKLIVYQFNEHGGGGIGAFIGNMKIVYDNINTNFKIDLQHSVLKKYFKIKDEYKYNPKIHIDYTIVRPEYIWPISKNDWKAFSTKTKFKPLDYFNIDDTVINHLEKMKEKNNINYKYNAIHIRLGDHFMKKTKNQKWSKDIRRKGFGTVSFDNFIDTKIEKIINNKLNEKFILFSDNNEVKQKYSKKYDNLVYIPIEILHTDKLKNIKIKDQDVLDNICEFLLISKAENIHVILKSSFPITSYFMNQNNNLILHY